MKQLFFLFLFFSFYGSLCAQDSGEYEFDKARAMLAQRNINEAVLSLQKIYRIQPESGNINFLLGAAFAELPNESAKAVYHLKKALLKVSTDYVVGDFNEDRAPIHVYYYLTLALVQEDRCAEAAKSLIELKKYKNKLDEYFILEAEKNMVKCPYEPEQLKKINLADAIIPKGYDPMLVVEDTTEIAKPDSVIFAEKGLLVMPLEYTTKSPIYGVQIGSNVNPSPISNFSKVKNLDVFVDSLGFIRYVVGHFSYRSQAESLLESLVEKGYEDAFVVNINDERKYANELISYRNINIRAGIKGAVEFFIQLGAFSEQIPDSIVDLYHEIDQLEEVRYEKKTLLLVGPFSKYKETLEAKEGLAAKGVKNSFIVAFNRRKKIDLQEAINYTE